MKDNTSNGKDQRQSGQNEYASKVDHMMIKAVPSAYNEKKKGNNK